MLFSFSNSQLDKMSPGAPPSEGEESLGEQVCEWLQAKEEELEEQEAQGEEEGRLEAGAEQVVKQVEQVEGCLLPPCSSSSCESWSSEAPRGRTSFSSFPPPLPWGPLAPFEPQTDCWAEKMENKHRNPWKHKPESVSAVSVSDLLDCFWKWKGRQRRLWWL